jgi:hypothetical protein
MSFVADEYLAEAESYLDRVLDGPDSVGSFIIGAMPLFRAIYAIDLTGASEGAKRGVRVALAQIGAAPPAELLKLVDLVDIQMGLRSAIAIVDLFGVPPMASHTPDELASWIDCFGYLLSKVDAAIRLQRIIDRHSSGTVPLSEIPPQSRPQGVSLH